MKRRNLIWTNHKEFIKLLLNPIGVIIKEECGIEDITSQNNLKAYQVFLILREEGIHLRALNEPKGNDFYASKISNEHWSHLLRMEFEVKTTTQKNSVSCDAKTEVTVERMENTYLITAHFNGRKAVPGFIPLKPFQLKAIYLTHPKYMQPYWNKRRHQVNSRKGSDAGAMNLTYIINHSDRLYSYDPNLVD